MVSVNVGDDGGSVVVSVQYTLYNVHRGGWINGS